MHILSRDVEIREDIREWLAKEYPTNPSLEKDVAEVGEAEGAKEEERSQKYQEGSAGIAMEEEGKQEHAEVDEPHLRYIPTKLIFHSGKQARTIPITVKLKPRPPPRDRAARPKTRTKTSRPFTTL